MVSWVTMIYASPNSSTCKDLWKEIDVLATASRDPWLLAGDFNIIRYNSKKNGVCKLFNDCCFKNNFCELTSV